MIADYTVHAGPTLEGDSGGGHKSGAPVHSGRAIREGAGGAEDMLASGTPKEGGAEGEIHSFWLWRFSGGQKGMAAVNNVPCFSVPLLPVLLARGFSTHAIHSSFGATCPAMGTMQCIFPLQH
jgi:hypothetical protein